MNTDILKDLSRCHAAVDAFVIDHYDDLHKIIDMTKEDGADERLSIEHLIDAFLQIGYDSGMTEMRRRDTQCKMEQFKKP